MLQVTQYIHNNVMQPIPQQPNFIQQLISAIGQKISPIAQSIENIISPSLKDASGNYSPFAYQLPVHLPFDQLSTSVNDAVSTFNNFKDAIEQGHVNQSGTSSNYQNWIKQNGTPLNNAVSGIGNMANTAGQNLIQTAQAIGGNPQAQQALNSRLYNQFHIDNTPQGISNAMNLAIMMSGTPRELPETNVPKFNPFGPVEDANIVGQKPLLQPTEQLRLPVRPAETGTILPESSSGSVPPPVNPLLDSGNHYINEDPLKINVNPANPNATVQDIRDAYTGSKNSQMVRINQLADEIKKLVPDSTQREGITFLRESGGDTTQLQSKLADPNFVSYKPAIEAALSPSVQMQQANNLLEQYFKESGAAGQKFNFLNDLRENYINRIYKPEPPQTFPATEVNRSGLPKSTYHAEGRVFNTMLDAIDAGKIPATLDATDLLKVHGAEFSKVLTNNKLLSSLQEAGLGDNFEGGKLPADYSRIGNSNFWVPDFLSNGLRSITEPNFINKIDEFRGLQKYQSLVKTVDLSFSMFHHFTMAMQFLYQNKFGLDLPGFVKFAHDADFNNIEQDFTANTGMTSNIDSNKEVLSKIGQGTGLIDKFKNLPIAKQGFDLIEKNNNFLFGTIQKWLKVMDYGAKVSSWISHNPDATDLEITAAKRGFASEINSAYGGLNWESLGKTPSFQSAMRLFQLAPDWTYSNVLLLKEAAQGGTAGAAARSHLISAVIGGAILTEGLSKIITGHFTDQNTKGHQTEVEIRPGVYISFFRGGIGDILKEIGYVKENGLLQGTARFAQGKLSPIARTATGLLSGVDYNGNQLAPAGSTPGQKDLRYAGFLGQNLLPVPFGGTNLIKLATKGNTDPFSYAAVASGVGRPGVPSTPANLATQNYFDARTTELAKLSPRLQNLVQGIPLQDPADPIAKQTKYSIVKSSPDVFNYFKNIATAQANGDVTKLDPLYALNFNEAQPYLLYESQNPGSQDKKDLLKAHPEILKIINDRSTFYQNNPIPGGANTSSVAPQPNAYVQAQMQIKNWQDPQVQAYLNATTAYNNQLRSQLGLTPIASGGSNYTKRIHLSRTSSAKMKFSKSRVPAPKTGNVSVNHDRIKLQSAKISLAPSVAKASAIKIPTFTEYLSSQMTGNKEKKGSSAKLPLYPRFQYPRVRANTRYKLSGQNI